MRECGHCKDTRYHPKTYYVKRNAFKRDMLVYEKVYQENCDSCNNLLFGSVKRITEDEFSNVINTRNSFD